MEPRSLYIEAMRHAASSVAVVTTAGDAGSAGITVSAVCSLSADPPSILVCINESSPVLDMIRRNGCMCINLLAADQSHVADSFAGRIAKWRSDRFACATWTTGTTGAPELSGALAVLDCRLARDVPYASHAVLIGDIQAIQVAPREGLLYVDRSYRHVGHRIAAHTEACS